MYNLENILLGLLVVDALALIVLVLIQQGKGADVGAAFGGGSSNTMFGSAGSGSFLSRTTTWLSIGFFLISFGLAYTAKERAASVSTLGIPQVSAPASQSGAESAAGGGVDGAVIEGAVSEAAAQGGSVELEMIKQEAGESGVVPDLPDGAELQDSLDSIESAVEDAVESSDLEVPDL